MYNVNNKFAMKQGGWNTVDADVELKDHTMREIARPNNDTFYIGCMLDLRHDPVILDTPAFDSKYVSLMVTAYDHYVNVPMATRLGDFRKPEKILLYSARTEGYDGEAVDGVDRVFETSGDFVSAVFRIMPHASDPERFQRIVGQMQQVKLVTLSEYKGVGLKPIDDLEFPPVGKLDVDIFENNLLEVMQFVFNHTTFDAKNEMDRSVLEAFQPLGVEPGRRFDKAAVTRINGERFRKMAERVRQAEFSRSQDPAVSKKHRFDLFKPKGQISLDVMVMQSVTGPIGLPAAEAIYLPVASADGQPMNALHDYVIHMPKAALPPAGAFWSLTLYDSENGFFIPNDRKKYSVGENAGMKLNDDGGIDVYVSAGKPDGIPEENWLPIQRKDEVMDIILRVFVPDLQKMKTWSPPAAEKIGGK
jgi:hypothetical protein